MECTDGADERAGKKLLAHQLHCLLAGWRTSRRLFSGWQDSHLERPDGQIADYRRMSGHNLGHFLGRREKPFRWKPGRHASPLASPVAVAFATLMSPDTELHKKRGRNYPRSDTKQHEKRIVFRAVSCNARGSSRPLFSMQLELRTLEWPVWRSGRPFIAAARSGAPRALLPTGREGAP